MVAVIIVVIIIITIVIIVTTTVTVVILIIIIIISSFLLFFAFLFAFLFPHLPLLLLPDVLLLLLFWYSDNFLLTLQAFLPQALAAGAAEAIPDEVTLTGYLDSYTAMLAPGDLAYT